MANFLILFFSVVSFSAIFYYIGKSSKLDLVSFESMKSEIADPTVNFPPTFFKGPHYDILEVLFQQDPYEMTRKQINYHLGKSLHHAYERELWLEGYVNRRVQKLEHGSVHYYTLTSKGKEALVLYSYKF